MENKYVENLFIMYLEQGSNYFRLAHFFVGLTTITLIYFMTFRWSSFSYHIISTKHNKQIQFELKSNKKNSLYKIRLNFGCFSQHHTVCAILSSSFIYLGQS